MAASTSFLVVNTKGAATKAPRMLWATALTLLELSSTTGVLSPHVSSFLTSHLAQLQSLHDLFPRTKTSYAAVQSGKVELGGASIELGKEEQNVVRDVADRFDVDELEALLAIRGLKKGKVEKLEEEDWDLVTAHVFEERMGVIGCAALLFRCSEDPSHPCHELATTLLPSITTPAFASALLRAVAHRTILALPEAVSASSQHSVFWAKQLVREQKALLEVLFLFYYSSAPPSGPELVALFNTLRVTEWCQRQEIFGFFDLETTGLVHEIGDLLLIIAVEGLNLEVAMGEDYPIPSPSEPLLDPDSVYHPTNLQAINDAMEALVKSDGVRAAPLLLGWAFILSRVTNSLVERGVPEAYHAFANKSLRVESGTPSSSQPLFQLYAAHALLPSSKLFESLLAILHSPLFSISDVDAPAATLNEPNAVGYISVLRALVTCLPLIVRLSFFTSEQYASLVDVFAALYGHPGAAQLCAQFWEERGLEAGFTSGAESVGEAEIVELARSRFPVQFGSMVKIVRALCQGATGLLAPEGEGETEDEELAKRCAECAFACVGTFDFLTHVVRPTSAVTPLPYEVVGDPDPANISFRSTRPIQVSKSLTIPVGTRGRLVSQQGRKPVVISWELSWSGWRLFGDVLEDFANVRKGGGDVFGAETGAGLPIEWEDERERAEDVTAVLDIFRITLTNDSSLGTRLVEHMAEATPTADRTHFVEVLFRILELSLSSQRPASTKLVSSLLGLISALLPSYPGVIWTFLRGSSLLFPSTSPSSVWSQDTSRISILQNEKLAGTYPVTLALLSLVRALVLEDQVSSYAVPAAFEEIKQGVLVRALSWVRDEIWSVSGTWRFVNLAEKYEMSKRMVQLYRLVLEEGELAPNADKGQFDPVVSVVVDALLVKATVAQLSPLLSAIAAGPGPITILRKALRFADAQASEDLVELSLALVRKLLRLRRRIVGSTPSLLERIALSHGTPQGLGSSTQKVEMLECLSKYIVAPIDPKTATQAAKVLTLLCIGSGEWQPRPPSLISLLGGSDRTEKFVTAMLAVASDPLAAVGLQVAIWDLMSSIVETQPSLALLLVTGRHYPFDAGSDDKGKAKAADQSQTVNAAEESAKALAKSLAPAPFRPLPRTAIGVGLETVGTWEEAWEGRPSLLAAVLRFFDFAWQHLVDYGAALEDFRTRPAPWDAIVKIAFRGVGEQPSEDAEVTAYCHRTMAKAHAVRILALDTQAAISRPGSETPTSAKALLKSLADKSKLTNALLGAISTPCAPNLHQGIFELIQESFPEISIDSFRLPPQTHPLDDAREFGSGYLYSLPLLRRKLDGFMSESDAMIGHESLVDVIVRTGELNLNFSLLEAQISHTRSWRQLLEIVLPLLRRDAAASANVLGVASLVAEAIANEDREGQIMTTVHEERLSILLTMVEILQGMASPKVKDDLVVLLDVSRIFTSDTLPPLESVARRTTPLFHRTLFRIAYFIFRKLNVYNGVGRDLFKPDQKASLAASTDAIMRVMLTGTRDIFVLARAKKDVEIAQDLTLAVAVLSQIVHSPFVPPPSIWLAYCQSVDFFRRAFELFVHMDQLDGRPLYAQLVLDLCLAMASSTPRAAEQMALEGLMTALTNNALTASAEAGSISVLSMEGERTAQHELWTSMLALVVSLVSALGDSTQFVEQEVTGFVRLYGAQIAVSMGWNADSPLTFAGLEETQNAVALMYGLVHRAGGQSPVMPVFADQALNLLQQIVYAILHPNHLSILIEPVTAEERAWLDKDHSEAETDLAKRPVVGSVTMALVKLARVIVDSLLAYTQAFTVLTKESSEWRTDRAIVIPTANVTSNERASIGTLFDLASFSLDILRQPSTPTPAPALTSSPLPPYSSETMSATVQQTLEATLLLAATQLALWLERIEPTRAGALMRREISGELAGDLVSTLERTANLGGKVEKGKKEAGLSMELVGVLKGFVRERLVE